MFKVPIMQDKTRVAVRDEEILRSGDNETILSIFVACGLEQYTEVKLASALESSCRIMSGVVNG